MHAGSRLLWGGFVFLISATAAAPLPPCNVLLDGHSLKMEPSADLVDGLIECGDRVRQDGKLRDSARAFDLAAEMARKMGDQARLAHALEGSGNSYQLLGELARAEPLLRDSLRIREELKDKQGIADSLAALGRYYITAGDDLKCREYSERSLKLDEELGNRVGVAISLNNIGISWKYHDVSIALNYFEKTLEEFKSLGEERRANVVLNNVANAYNQLGDLEHAIELSRQVMATQARIGDPEKAGGAETSLGIDYLELGDYRAALQFLQKSLAIRVKQGYTFGVAEGWNNLALVYRAQGAYDQAAAALEKTLALTRKLDNRDLEAEGLANLGEVQFLAGKPTQAEQSLKTSLRLAEKLDAKLKIAFATFNLGRLYLSEGRMEEASAYLKRSLETEEQIHDGLEQGQTLVALSDLERKRGNLERSREFASRAALLGRQTGQPEVQWTALTAMGRADKALGRPDQARESFDAAIAVLEDLRTRVAGGESERAVFFASKTEPYQERMVLALEGGHPEEAFHYGERARARALLDTINGHREPLSKAMTPEERAQERRLRLALNAASLSIQSAQQDDELLHQRQDKARREYEAFQTTLYAAHPDLRVARAEIPAIQAQEAEGLLTAPASALLEFAVTPEQTFLFVITADGLHWFKLKISAADLGRRVEKYRAQLANRDLRVAESARQLHTLLIAPARAVLAGKRELIIAPDGPLWDLPFQALESRPGRFLIEDCAISYAPSFTVLREERRLEARRGRTPASLLAIGNPARKDTVPETARQVQVLAALYGPSSRVYTGSEATEENWKREAPRYRVLQFATHAVLDDRSPLYSHIVLAEPGPHSSEDGLLEAWELMQLDLNAGLSVLSACETARGRVTAGEGLIGLTWSFFVSGSPAALVSQWKVDAKSTNDLMLEFHRQWRGGTNDVSKARALQAAQLHLLHGTDNHPFDWAGFILVGDAE